jgi:hypothetical protein
MLKLTINSVPISIGQPREEMMSFELKQKIPDPELLLTLEPEELAGVLLPILKKQAGKDGTVSGYNFANNFRQMQEIYPRQYEVVTKLDRGETKGGRNAYAKAAVTENCAL